MLKPPLPKPSTARVSLGAFLVAHLDLLILLILLVSDVRVFKGSAVSSFTLLELFIWGYCAPYVVSCVALGSRPLPRQSQNFVFSVALYGAWLCLVSALALLFRGTSDPLQNAKNVFPGLIMVPFLVIRLRDVKSVLLLSNVYVLYGVAAASVAVLQFKFGGPYFKELLEGTEYKQDLLGDLVSDPVVGFSGHPNEFAMSIIPPFALAAVKVWYDLRRRARINLVALCISALLMATMVLAQAKGAFVFSITALLFVLSPLGRQRGFLIKLGWVIACTVAIVLFGLYTAESGAIDGAATVEVRFLLWQVAVKSLTADWYIAAFGDGRGYIQQWSQSLAGWEFPDSHNAWIDQFVMFGLPALALYLAIWWQFFRAIETPVVAPPAWGQLLLDGFRVSLLAIMGDSFFEPVSNDVSAVAQLLLIMTMALRLSGDSPTPQPRLPLTQVTTRSKLGHYCVLSDGRRVPLGLQAHFRER